MTPELRGKLPSMPFDFERALEQAKAIPEIHDRQGAHLAPTPEQLALVGLAADALNVKADFVREIDASTGGLVWFAQVTTARGTSRVEVTDERSWEEAFRDLGLLP